MILGAIAGDIVGSPYEFNNTKGIVFPLFSTDSRPTDDSVMTIAIAQAVMRSLDEALPLSQAAVECMHDLGHAYPRAGYGYKFAEWLRTPVEQCRPYGSWGNGSAMRVSPVAWAYDTLELVEEKAAQTAEVTHNHPSAIAGAQAIAAGVFLARNGVSKSEIAKYVSNRYGYDLAFSLDDIRDGYEFDVSCAGSVPVAFAAFLEGDSFENVVRKAVSVGGDSDTIGSMAAALAQAVYGIPSEIETECRSLLDRKLIVVNDLFCERFLRC